MEAAQYSGLDLRILRTERRLKVRDIARVAGVARQRITAIESTERPTPNAIQRYLEALRVASQ